MDRWQRQRRPWTLPGCALSEPHMGLYQKIKDCRRCESRFAQTHTAHEPRPVVWFQPGAKLLIAGQAPGMRVHLSGRPFDGGFCAHGVLFSGL